MPNLQKIRENMFQKFSWFLTHKNYFVHLFLTVGSIWSYLHGMFWMYSHKDLLKTCCYKPLGVGWITAQMFCSHWSSVEAHW